MHANVKRCVTQLKRCRRNPAVLVLLLAAVSVVAVIGAACTTEQAARNKESAAAGGVSLDIALDDPSITLSPEEAQTILTVAFDKLDTEPTRMHGSLESQYWTPETEGPEGTVPAGITSSTVKTEVHLDGDSYYQMTDHRTSPDTSGLFALKNEHLYVDGMFYERSTLAGAEDSDDPSINGRMWIRMDPEAMSDLSDVDVSEIDILPADQQISTLNNFEDHGVVEQDGERLRKITARGDAVRIVEHLPAVSENPQIKPLIHAALDNYSINFEFLVNVANQLVSHSMTTKLDLDFSSCVPGHFIPNYFPDSFADMRYEELPAETTVATPDPEETEDFVELYRDMPILDSQGRPIGHGDDSSLNGADAGPGAGSPDSGGERSQNDQHDLEQYRDTSEFFRVEDFIGCPV